MDLQINISTPRLHLRLMEESDAKDVLEILGDKETAELGGISSLSTLDDASKQVASKCGFVLDGLYKDFLEFSDEHKEDVEFFHVDNPYQLAS